MKSGKIKPEKGMMMISIRFGLKIENDVTKGDSIHVSWYTDDKTHWNYVNEGWSGTIGV